MNNVGFLAFWRNKPSEYHASCEEEAATSAAIDRAFENARIRGVEMYGRYGCRWSTPWQYFAFWTAPSVAAIEDAIDDLEHAGDFKFADSHHYLGLAMEDPEMTRTDRDGISRALGFCALWRRGSAYYRDPGQWAASDREIRRIFSDARAVGVEMYGRFDCRWSSAWEYFTFWRVPSYDALEAAVERLEPAGDFKFADSFHLLGIEEPRFRFGRHLSSFAIATREEERVTDG